MLFSVIMPVYNKGRYVDRAIESVLKQNNRDYELIIVNDGSLDDSLEKINRYKEYPGVKIFNRNNQGVSISRNIGIENAEGECITFLDPDDEWKENHLEKLEEVYIQTNKMDALFCTGYEIEMLDGSRVRFNNEIDRLILQGKNYGIFTDLFKVYNKFKYGVLHTNSVMIPKRIFDVVGNFSVGCIRSQDTDMWYRVMLRYPVVLISEITSVYYRNIDSTTSSITRNYQWPFFDTVEKEINCGNVNPSLVNDVYCFTDELRISMARHLIKDGEKKRAFSMISDVHFKRKFGRKIIITALLFFVPSKLILFLYNKINRKYIIYS